MGEKKMKITTHRSSKGKKLYAVRDKKGHFKDIQSYKRSHASDLRHIAKSEKRQRLTDYIIAFSVEVWGGCPENRWNKAWNKLWRKIDSLKLFN